MHFHTWCNRYDLAATVPPKVEPTKWNFQYSTCFFSIVGSGKSCTMFGNGVDAGILRKSVEFLLKASTDFSIQIVEIHEEKIYDCVNADKVDVTLAAKQPLSIQINSLEQFDEVLDTALKNRTQKATNQNHTSSRSHAIIKIFRNESKNGLLFADLAGFESQQGKDNQSESRFINNSLLELNKVLLSVSKNGDPVCTTALTKYFKPYFKGDVIMFYHIRAECCETVKSALDFVKDLSVVLKTSPTIKKPNAAISQKSSANVGVRQNRIPFSELNVNSARSNASRQIFRMYSFLPSKVPQLRKK